MQGITVADFSGGITDNIKLGFPNQAEKLDNVIITEEGGFKVRPGSRVYSNSAFRIPSTEKITHFMDFDDLFVFSARHLYRVTSTPSIVELRGSTNNLAFDAGDQDSKFCHSIWRNQALVTSDAYAKPSIVYNDSINWQLVTAGLPRLDLTGVTLTSSAGAGASTYLYSFCMYYTYTVGTVVHEVFSGVEFKQATSNVALGAGVTMTINNIPVLSNGATLNYGTTVKIKIYRTEDAGTVPYEVGEVANGVINFVDTLSDADIVDLTPLYTVGGAVENDEPPLCKYNMVVENTAYYVNVSEDGEEKGFRIRLSKTGNILHCPESFYKDFDTDLTACSNIRSIPIVFANNKIWRLDGVFADDGTGGVVSTLVSSNIGCVSNESIIKLDSGLAFASEQGWAFTDGYRAWLISKHLLPVTYPKIVDKDAICSAYDPVNGFLYWGVEMDGSSDANDTIFVLDEKKGIKSESCFTKWNNPNSFYPSAIIVKDGELIRGDKYGLIYIHKEEYRNDTKPTFSGVLPEFWSNAHIPYNYTSTELFTDSKELKKFGGKVMLRAKNISDVSILLSSANNGYKNFNTMPEIRRRDGIIWGGKYIPWGTAGFEWQNTEDIEEIRHMGAGGQMRFYTKQIRITPAWTEIEKSDDRCTATIDDTTTPFTVTLDTPIDYDWDDDCVGYWIYFEGDNYVQGFEITSRDDSDNIRIATPLSPPSAGSQKWRIMGYPKRELIEVVSYSVFTTIVGNQFKPYNTADSGGNA